MSRSGAITMLALGAVAFAVLIGFLTSSAPLDAVGRARFPAIVIEVVVACAGAGCVIYGVRGLRRKR